MTDKSKIIEILENFWPKNKAKGLLAQAIFSKKIKTNSFGKDAKDKIIPGCWLLAPKGSDFYKFRFCFFVHPVVVKTDKITNNIKKLLGEKRRPFYAIADFMQNAGIGVIYVLVHTKNGTLPLNEIKERNYENINWHFFSFSFQNEDFVSRDAVEFFKRWEGDSGRARYGDGWDPVVKKKINKLGSDILTEMLLNELFYIGFVKGTLKKPLNDPYDVDSFMMSISQKHVFPMEIKEKFPGQNRDGQFFGIDAGRIMMLLRLCIPNDANAVYLIRGMNKRGRFIGWKYITLSDIIMTSSWNLQAGGPGMGGQSTQTIRLPYDFFKSFNKNSLSEGNLKTIGNLPEDIKNMAIKFGEELSARFHGD